MLTSLANSLNLGKVTKKVLDQHPKLPATILAWLHGCDGETEWRLYCRTREGLQNSGRELEALHIVTQGTLKLLQSCSGPGQGSMASAK